MSTTNPDEVAKTIRHRLIPLGLPIAVIGVLIAPVLFIINQATDHNQVWVIIAYVLISVAAGLFGYYVVRPTPGCSRRTSSPTSPGCSS